MYENVSPKFSLVIQEVFPYFFPCVYIEPLIALAALRSYNQATTNLAFHETSKDKLSII